MNVYTYLRVKRPAQNKFVDLPTYSFIYQARLFDCRCLAFYQDPATQNLQEFTFDDVFPYSSTDEEIYEAVKEPIIKQLAEGTSCVLLLYGDKDSGKTTTLLGSEGKGIIHRILLDLINYGKGSRKIEGQTMDNVEENPACGENPELSLSGNTVTSSEKDRYYESTGTTVEVSHLLTNNKFEIYDLLLPIHNLPLVDAITSIRRQHLEAMKVGENSKSHLDHKISSEENLRNVILTSNANVYLYESSKAKEDHVYDTIMRVTVEFKRGINKKSVFSHFHLLETSEYEPLLKWLQKESFFQNSSPLIGQHSELSILQNVLWKSIQEKQSLHLIGCVMHESSHFPQNVAVCRFANTLYDHLSSRTTAMTSPEDAPSIDEITQQNYQDLLMRVQLMQEETEEMKEQIAQLEMKRKGSNPFDWNLSPSMRDYLQLVEAVHSYSKARQNMLRVKLFIKDYETLFLRKELQACRRHLEGSFHRSISDSETRLRSSIPPESTVTDLTGVQTSSASLISERSLDSDNAILTNSLEKFERQFENEASVPAESSTKSYLPCQRHEFSFTLDKIVLPSEIRRNSDDTLIANVEEEKEREEQKSEKVSRKRKSSF